MKLYLIPTNLAPETQNQVLTPQIFEAVKNINAYFVEELRTARRFIGSLKMNKVIDAIEFQILDKKTSEIVIESKLKRWLSEGKDVGIMSEAGCPAVADPGALAVKIAHKLGIEVMPLVGPSSILLALMGSGFSGQSFAFSGYLPIDRTDRIKGLAKLARLSGEGQTQIFMETPFRNNQVLEDILANTNGELKLCIATDITSNEQFIKTLTINQWKKSIPDLHKKPTIFLLGN
ncbi:MAG: SAM-dependent methyltransferase [Bacteroidota bacterium]